MIIGYTAGAFDLFHIGHLNFLRTAAAFVDRLIVGVSTDDSMEYYKGNRAVCSYDQRVEIVRAIRYVDAVVPSVRENHWETWQRLRFNVFLIGDDWRNKKDMPRIAQQLGENGVRVIFLPYTEGISTTDLVKRIQKWPR